MGEWRMGERESERIENRREWEILVYAFTEQKL